MVAVTEARSTPEREGREFNLLVATGENIYQGSLCQLDGSGELIEAVIATGNNGGYIAQETVLDAAAGARIDVISDNVVLLDNGNSLDITDIGMTAYAEDNATVHNTAATRSAIGQVVDVDDDGVWVLLRPQIISGLTAANNLSDVGDAALARGNLGIIHNILIDPRLDIDTGNSAQIRYVHSGPDMTINHIRTVCGGSAATGTAILTADIEATPITNGVVTIAADASEDDVDFADPSAANVISEDEVLTITVSGTQDAAIFASVMIEGSY